MDFVGRKEWIKRKKEREKIEFSFKKGKGEKGKEKINLLELIFFP